MEFNYALLEETRAEIKRMKFFKEDQVINEEEYEIIYDLEKAIDNAFNRYDYKYGEFDGQTWCDILEENMSEVREIIYQNSNYAELSKILNKISVPEIYDIQYSFDDEMIQEEIEAELLLCAKSRFVCGKENTFFESLFKAYSLGIWPCGWNNGKIIVYVSNNTDDNM